jgi:hypothetical protein
VSNNLGEVMLCESHVNTRLRSVHKLVAISGSPSKVVTLQMSYELREFVRYASTELNAADGVFFMNDTESGVVLHHRKERESVEKTT